MAERTLASIIGMNVAAVRRGRGWRQDDLARHARSVGLDWTRNLVAKLESGHRGLSAEELLLLPDLLTVPLAELLRGPLGSEGEHVRMAELTLPVEELELLPRGHGSVLQGADSVFDRRRLTPDQREIADRYDLTTEDALLALFFCGEAEEKAAVRLGVSATEVAFAAAGLWGQTLTQHRDSEVSKRGGGGAVSAHRGHVTRELLALLSQFLRSRD